eukprot:COSAG03_NODE_169_length_11255_cov_5.793385_13_plen_61_part_00
MFKRVQKTGVGSLQNAPLSAGVSTRYRTPWTPKSIGPMPSAAFLSVGLGWTAGTWLIVLT